MKKPIITIAGVPGAGKSTTAKKVATHLGYSHFSSGDIFRDIASEYGVDIASLNKIVEDEKEIDFRVDQRLRDIGVQEKDVVIDSRTAFHWIPDSFKVYLKLDPDTAAKRVFTQIQVGGRMSQTASTIQDVKIDIETRITSELKRYAKLYELDYTQEKHYDLVIDTARHSIDEVVEMIVAEYRKRHLGPKVIIDNN